ncbi:hypothetical protein LXL04_014356 [Taraxacum kok-saghyz]
MPKYQLDTKRLIRNHEKLINYNISKSRDFVHNGTSILNFRSRDISPSILDRANPEGRIDISIKVNIFLWRLAFNHHANRVNMEKRCIDLDSSLCPVCSEEANHIFFSCHLAIFYDSAIDVVVL